LLLIYKGSEAYKLKLEASKNKELINKIIFILPIILVAAIIFVYWYKTKKSYEGV